MKVFVNLSDELVSILNEIGDDIAFAILDLENNPKVENKSGVSMIDTSSKDWMLHITFGKKESPVKIGSIIRDFYPGEFQEDEIYQFAKSYNQLKNKLLRSKYTKVPKGPVSTALNVIAKKADYNDVRETFLSMVTETYPNGHEEETLHLLPSDLLKDKFGNYYKLIGDSTTMFTSHLDTTSYKKSKVNLFTYKEGADDIICTDGTSILGADDKAGVALMLYMITKNVPGVYYFFIGEERGCIGSSAVAAEYESFKHLEKVSKVVAFDRRNYHSVITEQMGGVCCSDEFANALSSQINKGGLSMAIDPTGVYTDSACFMDDMPEITNVSVGYFDEHTNSETQNISFLERLAKALVNVDWENLPVKRKIGITQEMLRKFKTIISAAKIYSFDSENTIKVMGNGKDVVIRLEVTETGFDQFYTDIITLNDLLTKSKINNNVTFEDNKLKINIKS